MKRIFKIIAIVVISIFGVGYAILYFFIHSSSLSFDFCHCKKNDFEVIYSSDSEEKKSNCKRDVWGLNCREVSERIQIAPMFGEFLKEKYRADFLPEYLTLFPSQDIKGFLNSLGSPGQFIISAEDENDQICRCAK